MKIVYKGGRPNTNFSIIPNVALRDGSITLRARGLLGIVMSHDDGYDLATDRIAADCLEGRDAVRNAMRELEANGYISRERIAVDGRFVHRLVVYPLGDGPRPRNA